MPRHYDDGSPAPSFSLRCVTYAHAVSALQLPQPPVCESHWPATATVALVDAAAAAGRRRRASFACAQELKRRAVPSSSRCLRLLPCRVARCLPLAPPLVRRRSTASLACARSSFLGSVRTPEQSGQCVVCAMGLSNLETENLLLWRAHRLGGPLLWVQVFDAPLRFAKLARVCRKSATRRVPYIAHAVISSTKVSIRIAK